MTKRRKYLWKIVTGPADGLVIELRLPPGCGPVAPEQFTMTTPTGQEYLHKRRYYGQKEAHYFPESDHA